MPKLVDRTGLRYERLVVIGRAPNRGRRVMWLCQCDCGNQTVVYGSDLHTGNTRSCGCLQREAPGKQPGSHGLKGVPEYPAWVHMRGRCRNPGNPAYHNYGGRGITIDPQWDNFPAFYTDMGPKPSSKHTLERIDNDGPYSPENCKWATRTEQANNTRRNRFYTFKGKTMSIAQWANEIGIDQTTLYYRVNNWSIERALTTPVG